MNAIRVDYLHFLKQLYVLSENLREYSTCHANLSSDCFKAFVFLCTMLQVMSSTIFVGGIGY